MKLADQERARRRALIDELFNGFPPYSPEEVAQNNITENASFLEPSRIHSDATSQCRNALLSTNQYVTVKVDRGPSHKRSEYSTIITEELRKATKDGASALRYIEKEKNVSSQLIVHGVGPTVWGDNERWCGSMQPMEDLLIPSRTLLTMENMEHFAVYRRYTPGKLWQMTHGANVDAGWKVDVAERAIAWAMKQGTGQDANDYTTGFSPERLQEDVKENGGIWNTDQVCTINAYDFFYTDYDDEHYGWKRRMVLDCPDIASMSINGGRLGKESKNILGDRGRFLYNSGNRTYADKLSEIVHFQFSDGSVVAPFRYHSVRSLGFLLYSVCHLQNRLRCAFTRAAFEASMQYFRASGSADVDRIVKLVLTDRAVIPDGINFLRPEERWQVNEKLIQTVLNLNKEQIADSSTGYNRNFGHEDAGPEKTATQITAEVNASSALVGSMLQNLYLYQKYQWKEICRRFCIKDSRDVDVRNFRAGCISRGVPEECLNVSCWNISVDQILGNGNKQLAIAQSQLVLGIIDRLDPDAQRTALRDFVFAVTGDPAKTNELVPQNKAAVTDSIHDATISSTTMLLGTTMGLTLGVNHSEYAQELLRAMAMQVQKILQRGGVATPEELAGLQILAGQTIDGQPIPGPNGPSNGVAEHLRILAQNKESKQIVKQLGDALGKLLNETKAFSQRLQEAQGEQQNGNGQIPPEQQAKIMAEMAKGQAKIKLMADTHAQKARQKEQTHAQQLQSKADAAAVDSALRIKEAEVNTTIADLEAASKIQRQAAEPAAE